MKKRKSMNVFTNKKMNIQSSHDFHLSLSEHLLPNIYTENQPLETMVTDGNLRYIHNDDCARRLGKKDTNAQSQDSM